MFRVHRRRSHRLRLTRNDYYARLANNARYSNTWWGIRARKLYREGQTSLNIGRHLYVIGLRYIPSTGRLFLTPTGYYNTRSRWLNQVIRRR